MAVLYDDDFQSYSPSQAPPYGNLGLYFGSFPTAIETTPAGPYGDSQCVDYYIPSSRLKYPNMTLSPALPFYQQFSVFFAYRIQSAQASIQATPLNFVSAINELGSPAQLLVLRVEQDGTISFVSDPSSPVAIANSGNFSILSDNWYWFQVNVSWATDMITGNVITTAQVAVDEQLILSATYDTGVLASALPGIYVNGILIGGGGGASQLGRLTIYDAIQSIGDDPHPGTPLGRVTQGTPEPVQAPISADVRVTQGVIELVASLVGTALTASCPPGSAVVGTSYDGNIPAGGGVPPYTFSVN